MITARGITKRLGAFALRVEHFSARQGEVVAVLGPSGAGKSTLLKLLAGLLAPDSGEVRREGLWAYLEQDPYLLDRPVWANAAFGRRLHGESADRARQATLYWLRRVGLLGLAERPARDLSGGERVRLALARALAVEPAGLLLDEPTANLDPANVARVEGLIREARDAGQGVVLVTHNLFQARRLADRALFLLAGEVVEAGPAPAFFTSPRDPRTRAFLSGEMVW